MDNKIRSKNFLANFLDLNYYQMCCAPRELENEENSEEISMDMFNKIKEVLYCTICGDIMKDPLNVKMCLHKYCAKCIEDYNRV